MITVTNREMFLRVLADFIPTGSIGCEIGVLHGDFSKKILDEIKPEELYLIDPFYKNEETYSNGVNTAYSTEENYQSVLQRFNEEIINSQVFVCRGFSYDLVDRFLNKTFDWIYHDGSHKYKDIKKDLNDWLPKMKDNAIIAGHDYIELEDFGVIQAVNEFMKEQGFEMILFNENGGDYALSKIKQ